MKKLLASSCLAFGLIGVMSSAQASECGTVSIASMNWASAELLANVDNFILHNGYGCDSSIVLGDTVPTLTSMAEKGQPDIAPEAWATLIPPIAVKNIEEGRLRVAGKTFTEGGIQGIYVPKFIIDKNPEIKTIPDAIKRPDLFPNPEDPSRGAWSAGQQGWGGTIIATQAYKAYEADKAGFDLVDTGSAAGHDGSITHAFERGQGWIGYYWEPTALLGKYDMVRLPAGVEFDEAEWNRCNRVENCPDPKPNEWPVDNVSTVVTEKFAENGGPVYEYLQARTWPNQTVNKMLAWMADNQATGEDAAIEFLKSYPDIWTKWVSPEVAEKVKSAL